MTRRRERGGWRVLRGEGSVKIHGAWLRVAAQVRKISGFSGHAGKEELERWMAGFAQPPQQVLLVHGEPAALEAHRATLVTRGWPVDVPANNETVPLAAAP